MTHIARVTIEEDGQELQYLPAQCPLGTSNEHGLFFVAFSADPTRFDKMLARMFGTSGDSQRDLLTDFLPDLSAAATTSRPGSKHSQQSGPLSDQVFLSSRNRNAASRDVRGSDLRIPIRTIFRARFRLRRPLAGLWCGVGRATHLGLRVGKNKPRCPSSIGECSMLRPPGAPTVHEVVDVSRT
jgi:hypothetical protein